MEVNLPGPRVSSQESTVAGPKEPARRRRKGQDFEKEPRQKEVLEGDRSEGEVVEKDVGGVRRQADEAGCRQSRFLPCPKEG